MAVGTGNVIEDTEWKCGFGYNNCDIQGARNAGHADQPLLCAIKAVERISEEPFRTWELNLIK